jgi:XTP/dITP diphosphohydrolase
MVLYFITGNKGKFLEAQKDLAPTELERKDVDLIEIQSLDAKEVISHKLKEGKKYIEGEFFVEDVSFEINALNKFPGPLIKWFLRTFSNKEIYEMCKAKNNFKARGIATIGYFDGEEHFFEGIIEGKVVVSRGESGFGWDPIFVPKGKEKTFAEMTLEEKNSISHRGMAIKKFKEFLNSKE